MMTTRVYSIILAFLLIHITHGGNIFECIIDPSTGDSSRNLKGAVFFKQVADGVEVNVDISGFEDSDVGSKRGFHIHEGESTGRECKDAKGHFNPYNVLHGGRTDNIRHVGDLGNIVVESGGTVSSTFVDTKISLEGSHNIHDKVVVIHAGEDDLGLGTGDQLTGSQKTGNAGARLACCKIKKAVMSAKCTFDGKTGITGDEGRSLTGTVALHSTPAGTDFTIDLQGFKETDTGTKHGFHIHEGMSTGNMCLDAKGHYNPAGVDHAGRMDPIRHVGDLGNVEVLEGGVMNTSFTDSVVSLHGMHSVIGRAIVVHAGEDDLGRGAGDKEAGSKATGNAGKRLACCIISTHHHDDDHHKSSEERGDGRDGGRGVGAGSGLMGSLLMVLVVLVCQLVC